MNVSADAGSPPAASTGAPDVPERIPLPFQFTGNASEYFRIWIVNVLLTIVTLGIYSAWAKVRNKQYFYRHSWLDGASFEYLADPWKILSGRLLAVAFLGLLTLSQQHSVAIYMACLAFLVIATPWILVKALGFNARNSAWRNVRFSFHGTTRRAAVAYLKGVAVHVFTFGFMFGVLQGIITRFIIENHAFGKLRFRFLEKPMAFFWIYLGAAYVTALPFGLLALLVVFILDAAKLPPEAVSMSVVPIGLVFYVAYFALVRTRVSNLVWSHTEIGNHRLDSTQRFRDMFWIQLSNIVAIVCTLGLAMPWAKVRIYRYRLEHLRILAAGPLIVEADPVQAAGDAFGDAANDLGDFDFGIG